MSPQLYKFVDAKLNRVIQSLYGPIQATQYPGAPPEVVRERESLVEAVKAIRRCAFELKYEYLGLKDSWL
jgi:hypothetical protein